MKTVGGMLRGPLVIDEDVRLTAMVAGDVEMRPGCRLDLRGMVSGDVRLAPGAEVETTGMIAGRIIRIES